VTIVKPRVRAGADGVASDYALGAPRISRVNDARR